MYKILQSFITSIALVLVMAAQAEPHIPDTMEQRLMACAQCHGAYGYGDVNKPEMPRLAEKPAAYLYKQMLLIKAGEGQNATMAYLMRQLSSEYLKKIADYYADQRVPFQQHAIPELSDAQMRRGEQLVNQGDPVLGLPACKQCHGQALTGVKPMIPGILNQPYDYAVAQLNLWRNNERSVVSTHCMWVVANRLLKTDVEAVAAWLAVQALPENRQPVAMDELPEAIPDWCDLVQSKVSL